MDINSCAPGKYDKKHNTCFTMDQLIEMAKAYNRFCAKNKLSAQKTKKISAALIDIKPDKKYLLAQFKKIMDNVCDKSQQCWTKQDFMNEIVSEMKFDIESNFRPNGPDNPEQWLGTEDINKIMMQYELVYPDFKFLGAVPFNCDQLSFCSLYKLNFNLYQKKGVHQIGIIFNLDSYGQPGSHWVALYINLAKGEIFFCDSNGQPPTGNINHIIESFKKFYQNKTKHDPVYHFNTNAYQQDGSECGVYSCNFLIRKLAGESFQNIVANPLVFQDINSCRNIYFSNKPSQYAPNTKCDPVIADE